MLVKSAIRSWLLLAWLVLGATAQAQQQQQPAGQVEFARGAGFVQSPGQAPRILGQGVPLQEGDRVTTAEAASAIVRLQDGTRMTVRPNSELVLQQYRYRENAEDNSFVMQLVRGGLRAVTGLVTRNAPNAARIQTGVATIGIRGTSFDARLCEADCGTEAERVPGRPRPGAVAASAKVVSAVGELSAEDGNGTKRKLVAGGSVFAGDLVETATGGRAVLAFRDDSRVTLGAATRFRVDNFVYDDKNPAEGRFLVSLVRGSLRALSGLIGKANTRNVGIGTPTATVGIRGTGLDLSCADTGCDFFTWLGAIEVTPNGQTALQVLQAGQGLYVGADGIRPLTAPILQDLPRPDGVQVDVRELFSLNDIPEDQPGLFVLVRDGHIEVLAANGSLLQLGRGEAGYAGATGVPSRLGEIPRFLDFDRIPLPTSRNPGLATLLGEIGIPPANQCR